MRTDPEESLGYDNATLENERYLWMQLEAARRERERARAALRAIREGIGNEEEHGLWEAEAILAIIDDALAKNTHTHTP